MAAPPRGLRLSHALRFGVAAASAVALAAGLGLERGYWLGITIAVVLHPSLDPTLERTAHRLPGTLIGAAVGAVIIAYVSDTWALIAIASLLLGVAGAFIGFHYGLAVAAAGGAYGGGQRSPGGLTPPRATRAPAAPISS
jgi:uncharacterized membrane protein YccC